MNAPIETFRANHAARISKYQSLVLNRFKFRAFMLAKLPMTFLAGLRVEQLTAESCAVSVPYKWLNQNPFQSTYFAVLAMAAEMSSGMLALMHTYESQPSISMLVTHLEADFVKKATTLTTFTCLDGDMLLKAIEEAVTTGEGTTIQTLAVGKAASGEEVARFRVSWSFKARK